MSQKAQHPDEFANRFESSFARLRVRIERACLAEPSSDWPARVAAGIRAALSFAVAHPPEIRTLTSDAQAAGREGHARYDRMIAHLTERLLAARDQSPETDRLSEAMERRAILSGLATVIAQRLESGRLTELPALAPEAIQFVLTPDLGPEQARRVAGRGGGT